MRHRRWIKRLLIQDVSRRALSWLLAVVAFVLSVAYAIPGMGFSRTLPTGRRSIVAFLDPTWTFVFGALAISLAVALLTGRRLVHVHTLGVTAFSFWSAAVFIGAVMSEPAGPITSAVLGVAVTVLHFWSAVDYAGDRR